MVVKPGGGFISQRQHPKMALVRVSIIAEGLRLSAPGFEDIIVDNLADDEPRVPVKIWHDHCRAQVAKTEVNQWISEFLQSTQALRLVKFSPEFPRKPYQPQRFGENKAQFADAAPYLVTNQASLDTLNTHLASASLPSVTMARFRPNIVISGLPAYQEHRLQTLDLGNIKLKMVDPCSRCAIITIDPSTGNKDRDRIPFQQLAELNSMPQQAKVPAFGVNACLLGENPPTDIQLKVGQQLTGY